MFNLNLLTQNTTRRTWLLYSLLISMWIVSILYLKLDINNKKPIRVHLHLQPKNLFHLRKHKTIINVLCQVNNIVSILPSNNFANPASKQIFSNFTKKISSYFANSENSLRLPTTIHLLPHLLDKMPIIKPVCHFSKNRSKVSLVIGIVTVQRSTQSHLVPTLRDLMSKMNENDEKDTLIVILIAEMDGRYISSVINDIESEFESKLESGLIEIISPPASFYPVPYEAELRLSDFSKSIHRTSKENLDFAFIMMYSYSKGRFYLQLSDHMLTTNNFASMLKDSVAEVAVNNDMWFVLDFCAGDFMGKMFQSANLPWFIQFIFIFFDKKPIDSILTNYVQTKAFDYGKNMEEREIKMNKIWIHMRQCIFHPIDITSSTEERNGRLR